MEQGYSCISVTMTLVKEVQGGFDSFWIFKGKRDTVQYSIIECGLNGGAHCWYGPKLLIIYSSVKPKECCQGTRLSLCGKEICLSASLWFGNILLLSSIKPVQSNTMEWCSTSEHTYVLSCTVIYLHALKYFIGCALCCTKSLHRVSCSVALLFSWNVIHVR